MCVCAPSFQSPPRKAVCNPASGRSISQEKTEAQLGGALLGSTQQLGRSWVEGVCTRASLIFVSGGEKRKPGSRHRSWGC